MPAPGPSHPALPRRAVLGGVLGVVVTAVGCAPATSPSGRGGHTTPKGSASSGSSRAVSPDVAVAISAASQVRQAADLLHRTVLRHPRLHPRLTALAAVHDAHLRLLRQAVPPAEHDDGSAPTTRRPVPPRAAAAVAGVERAERGLRQSLEGLAVQAQSGEFARLLAAMSAALGQQLALLAGDGAAR